MLLLAEMGEDDALWSKAVQAFGGGGGVPEECVELARLQDVVPMDPRVSLMMRAMVASVGHVTDKLERSQKRAADQSASRANRVILAWRRRIIEPCLRGWVDLVRSRKACGRRAAAGFMNSTLGKGWRQWKEQAVAMSAVRTKLSRFVKRLFRQGLARAWESWLEVATERQRMQAIGKRFANPQLSRALNAWIETAEEAGRLKAALRKAAGRLYNREIVSCWMIWSETAARVADNARKLRKLLRRAMHGKAGAAFRSWVALIEERAQMMHVFRYAMNANLGRAWRCWEECVEERHRL